MRALRSWEAGLALLLLAVVALMSTLSPYFLDPYNLIDSTLGFSEQGLIALAMALLIITREIDVSVASIAALAAVLMGLAADAGAPTPAIVAVGLVTGAAAGTLNGVIVSLLGVHSIVVTIGTLSLYRGLAVLIVGDGAYTAFPPGFAWLGQGYAGNLVPVEFVIYAAFTVLFALLLHATMLGRRIYAIGTNPEAARYSGVAVTRIKVALFALTGTMAGLAAVLLASRLGSVRLNIAEGWELQTITMVVLGGVAITGGRGTILGVTLAVLVIGLLSFGLALMNVPGIVMNIYIGAMMIGAIALPGLARVIGGWRRGRGKT